MEANKNFYKFPKTPHIEGSNVVDDDEIINVGSMKTLFKKGVKMVIQEKVDGANVSIHFLDEDNKYSPIVQKRSGLVEQKGEHEQYEQFRKWVMANIDTLWDLLEDKYVLFGEWLYCQHSVPYDTLPDFFLAFDLLEKQSMSFKSFQFLSAKLESTSINMVPLLVSVEATESFKFQDLIKQSKFSSKEVAEGLYIRLEDAENVLARFKLRRKTFEAGRKDFSRVILKNKKKDCK